MTFYWWSHWFWITLLSNILLHITIVQTYPSQEISLEYNQNTETVKRVTKLYQTSTTQLSWATAAPPVADQKQADVTNVKTILQSITPNVENEEVPLKKDIIVEHSDEHESGEIEDDNDESASDEFEFKRSVDNYNKTIGAAEQQAMTNEGDKKIVSESNVETLSKGQMLHESAAKLKRDETEVNNYTNFSSTLNNPSTNATNDIKSTTPLTSNVGKAPPPQLSPPLQSSSSSLQNADASVPISASASSQTSVSAAPSAPKIDSSTLEWLNAMAAQLPPTVTAINKATGDSDSETITTPHKIPFTLENVNKEEELRRAENEHRSRKSKVLSAEYKHINRFINYSADSKSLLTRSASTAPNDFDNSDEGNISSEALAIQRTYFLDAGAISAICFTIFGVCCTVGTIGIVLYRRRYLNKPQALSEPDSSVYIDDSTMRVSDNSDEMYSLDNDSFLNSLEAMTIQNYWTDTVKHTKL